MRLLPCGDRAVLVELPDRATRVALAADLHEIVVARQVGKTDADAHFVHRIVAQRKPVGRPAAMAQPGALVAAVAGDADQVARGALHAAGGGEDARQVRIARARVALRRQVERYPDVALVDAENAIETETLSLPPPVLAPQRGDAAAGAMYGDGEAQQVLALGGLAAPDGRPATGLGREFDRFGVEKHGG